jgi:hypothetical protein
MCAFQEKDRKRWSEHREQWQLLRGGCLSLFNRNDDSKQRSIQKWVGGGHVLRALQTFSSTNGPFVTTNPGRLQLIVLMVIKPLKQGNWGCRRGRCGFRGCEHWLHCLLGRDVMCSGNGLPVFWGCLHPQGNSSGTLVLCTTSHGVT